jgi:hypothetical protein
LNLVPERTSISGIWYNNTTYIPGSARTWLDGNTSQPGSSSSSPIISLNGNMYNMSWNIDPIKLSHTWTLTYQVRADKVGYTHPIGNTSFAAIHVYNSSDIVPVPVESDMVYVSSNLTDNMTDLDMLSISITKPYEGYNITQSSQDLIWTVNYHGMADYSVVKEYAPYGTPDNAPGWKPINGVNTANQTCTFSEVWGTVSQLTPNRMYTLRISATDGWFNATSKVNFWISYMPGEINVFDRR